MDPIIQLLMAKYGLPPDTAKSFAAKILLGNDDQSSAMRGEAAQMQTAIALQKMRAGEAQMAQMKAFQQSDPISAEALQRAQRIVERGVQQVNVAKGQAAASGPGPSQLVEQPNMNPAVKPGAYYADPAPDGSNKNDLNFAQNYYDRLVRSGVPQQAAQAQVNGLMNDGMPANRGPGDSTDLESMRQDYLASARPQMDDKMRDAYIKAAAKAPKHMVVRLADN